MPNRQCFDPFRAFRGTARRMSSTDVNPEEPVLESAEEPASSTAIPPVQTPLSLEGGAGHDGRRRRSATTDQGTADESSISSVSIGTADFEELAKIGRQYNNSPHAGKEWLESLTTPRLVSVARIEYSPNGISQTKYPSLLPLFSTWLESWFELVKKARADLRRRGRNPEEDPPPEDADLQWLYAYTHDYFQLKNEGYETGDIVSLVRSVLTIASLTGVVSDVQGSITVLHGVLSNTGCPDSIIGPTLNLLCGVRISMVRAIPERPAECIHLIIKGKSQKEPATQSHSLVRSELQLGSNRPTTAEGHENKAIAVLYGLVRDFDENKNAEVHAARGAVQTLAELIANEADDGVDVPDFDQLMDALLKGSQKHLPRLDAEILGLCYKLINDEERFEKMVTQDWTTFAELLGSLSKPILDWLNDDSPASLQSVEQKANDPIRQNTETLRKLNVALERVWDKLNYDQQQLMYCHFMQSPRFLSAEQSIRVIQYVQAATLFWPDKSNWQQKMAEFVEAFITDSQQPPECRVKAIEAVAETVKRADILTSPQSPEATRVAGEAAVSEVLRSLQDQVRDEADDVVMGALITELTELISQRSIDRTHARSVVKTLQSIALRNERLAKQNPNHVLQATNGLIGIFMRGMYFPGTRAMLAFDALVEIAGLKCPNVEARLAAMKMLFRIRCDSAGFVYVQYASESEYIAAALCRTKPSAEAYSPNEGLPGQRGSASSSSLSSLSKASKPLWMYPDPDPLPERPQSLASIALIAKGHQPQSELELNAGLWLETVVSCLQKDRDWETYSYIIVHLAAQLSNVDLFRGSLVHVNFLRRVLCEQINNASFHEPPTSTGLKKSDVAICMFNALTPLIAYSTMTEQFSRNDSDELVRAFLQGIGGQWEGTSRGCIHSLSICCLETPASVARSYPTILDRMLKNVTQSHLSVHILEFLVELARLPEEHSNIREDEVRNIFGICIRVLEIARDRKAFQSTAQAPKIGTQSTRYSGVSSKRIPPYRAAMISEIGTPQYEYALAYNTMVSWFLSLKLETRAQHVSWIIDRLVWKTPGGLEVIDEQSQVFVDMMQRTTFSDLGETVPHPDFAAESDGTVNTASWIVGLSIITIETAGATGRTQITKRQASGTTHSIYQQLTAETPYHHVPISTQIQPATAEPYGQIAMLPSHILLQMTTSATPTGLANQPLPLPNDDFVKRALTAFDRNPTVDGYKMGVIYVGEGQMDEISILSNTMGSPDFNEFLAGLGTQVSLEKPMFNTQGLVNEQDGLYTYAWRDRISEIIYHVPALMPTDLEADPQCINKKRHIGNDFVNIIFNRSGEAFQFNTIPSQFNYVNVVITPASRSSRKEAEIDQMSRSIYERARQPGRENEPWVEVPRYTAPKYYKVHVLTAEGFPSISPASDPKIISAAKLPSFVRLVGLNACVFAKAWLSRDADNEYPSIWRARLQAIRQLRERVVQRAAAAAPEPVRGGPLYRDRGAGERKSLYPEDRSALTTQKRVVDYDAVGAGQEETLGEQLDFSQWTQ